MDACKFEDPGRGGKAVSGFVDGGQALVEEAAVKKRPQCLMPKHNCRLRVATPGYYYDAAKDACIFTMKSGCPNVSNLITLFVMIFSFTIILIFFSSVA